MKDINYWDRFMNSGRIEDYLHFREESGRLWEEDMFQAKEGENPHAGIDHCNGNDFKDGAYR